MQGCRKRFVRLGNCGICLQFTCCITDNSDCCIGAHFIQCDHKISQNIRTGNGHGFTLHCKIYRSTVASDGGDRNGIVFLRRHGKGIVCAIGDFTICRQIHMGICPESNGILLGRPCAGDGKCTGHILNRIISVRIGRNGKAAAAHGDSDHAIIIICPVFGFEGIRFALRRHRISLENIGQRHRKLPFCDGYRKALLRKCRLGQIVRLCAV